jgi:hypothetical protein
MAYLLSLPKICDERGCLAVAEKLIPFEIKRFYFVYNVKAKRGGHRHKKTIQALICLGGSCDIFISNKEKEEIIVLDSPEKCLILNPEDWHTMDNFSNGSTLLVLSSEYYDKSDYIEDKCQ